MKLILTAMAALIANPVLAHTENNIHLHTSHASWVPMLLAVFVIAGTATTLAVVHRK